MGERKTLSKSRCGKPPIKGTYQPRFGGRKIVVPRRVLKTHVVESVRNGQENTRSGNRGRF